MTHEEWIAKQKQKVKSFSNEKLAHVLSTTNFSDWDSSDQIIIDEAVARIRKLSAKIKSMEQVSIENSIYNSGF